MPAKSEKYPWQPLEDVQGHARLPRYSEIPDWPPAGVPLAQCAVEPRAQNYPRSGATRTELPAQWSHAQGHKYDMHAHWPQGTPSRP